VAKQYARDWGEDLKAFPDDLFEHPAVQHLKLNGCFVEGKKITIPDKLGTLTKLKVIELHNMKVSALPESLGKLTNLVDLDVGLYSLTALPASLGKCSALKRIRLEDTHRLKTLPDSIGALAKLEELRAKPGGLKTVPAALWNATNLRRLALPETVKSLPPGIAKLRKLEELALGGAAFVSIVDEVVKLPKLKKLDIELVNARVLPDAVGDLEHLRELTIGGLEIEALPASLARLSKLTHLDVYGCYVLGGLADLVEQLPELEHVNFQKKKQSSKDRVRIEKWLEQCEARKARA
jgi:Leucine-rich repeat (LRR) protein